MAEMRQVIAFENCFAGKKILEELEVAVVRAAS